MARLLQFIRELRHRRVFRVAGLYLVGAWVVLQVADVISDPLGLPPVIMTTLVWLAVIGLPISIVLGWRYDLTKDGVVRTKRLDQTADADLSVHGVDYAIILALTVVAIVSAYGLSRVTETLDVAYPPGSIAVLPFIDLSPDGDQEHLGDGLAETLIHRLTQNPRLQVTARTSSFSFKDKNLDIRAIAGQLNCSVVLEGSIQKMGNLLRITAQLIDGESGTHLWSKVFNRTKEDFFLVQDDIAHAIVSTLKTDASHSEPVDYSVQAPKNFKAYDLYLLGRHHLHLRTTASLGTATNYFAQAIEQDPDYALAYTGLADSYLLLSQYGNVPIDEIYETVTAAIDRAMELDSNLAEVHASAGLLAMFANDYPAAEAAFKKAVQLNPNYAMAHMWYGRTLAVQARYDEALEPHKRARELDPLSPITNLNVALDYLELGYIDDSETEYLKLRELEPDFPLTYWGLGVIHWYKGEFDSAVIEILTGIEHGLEQWQPLLILSAAYADLGEFDAAEHWLLRASEFAGQEHPEIVNASLYLYLAREDYSAFRTLALQNLRIHFADAGPLATMGFANLIEGNIDQAEEYYERARSVAIDDYWLHGHWVLLWGQSPAVDMAFVLLETGQTEEARDLLKGSLQDWESRKQRGVYDIPAYRYMIARVRALEGNAELAIMALQEAVERGWCRYRWAKIDPAFARLQDNAAFQNIIREVEASVMSQKKNVARFEDQREVQKTVLDSD